MYSSIGLGHKNCDSEDAARKAMAQVLIRHGVTRPEKFDRFVLVQNGRYFPVIRLVGPQIDKWASPLVAAGIYVTS